MKYDLQDIATVSGLPGLFTVLKPTRTGVVLESMDEVKKRVMAQTRHKISILKEISIFTTTAENSVALEDVFAAIYSKYETKLELDHKKASNDELKAFLGEVVKDFDDDRVYASDIKKLVSWYKIISKKLKPVKVEKETKAKKAGAKKGDPAADKKPASKKKAAPKKQHVAKKAKPAPMRKTAVTKKNG